MMVNDVIPEIPGGLIGGGGWGGVLMWKVYFFPFFGGMNYHNLKMKKVENTLKLFWTTAEIQIQGNIRYVES